MSDYDKALAAANENIGTINRAITRLVTLVGLDIDRWQRILIRNALAHKDLTTHRTRAHPYRLRRHWGPARLTARRERLEK